MKKFGRRRLLLGGTLGVGAAFALYSGGWWYFKVREPDPTDIILAVLRRHLDKLIVKEEDLIAFAEAIREKHAHSKTLAWMGMVGPVYQRVDVFSLSSASRAKMRRFEDEIVSEFLLSTDFFHRGADESRELRYLGVFDPYKWKCMNPFATT